MKRSLITGITGQDGQYLTELLLANGYDVYGISRSQEKANTITNTYDIKCYTLNVLNQVVLNKIIHDVVPDEIYHLASTNSIFNSMDNPYQSFVSDCKLTLDILEVVKDINRKIKIFNAASSEIFGHTKDTVIYNENTIINPTTPYGIAKATAYAYVKYYRDTFGIFACNGILFNHSSPKQPACYILSKIATAVAHILKGKECELTLGNIDIVKDFGYASDYVRCMHMIMQASEPDDYVIATGEGHTLRNALEIAFGYVGLDYRKYVRIDKTLFRNGEKSIVGDISKLNEKLRWKPIISFRDMVIEMVENALKTEGRT